MSYIRVIPRDCFNEGNFLKCLGKLWIETQAFRSMDEKTGTVLFRYNGKPFAFEQDADGALYVTNVRVFLHGQLCTLRRPLNSREAWPLYLSTANGLEDVEVFDKDGNLSAELLSIINR